MLLFPEATTGDGSHSANFIASHLAAARDLLAKADWSTQSGCNLLRSAIQTPTAAWFGDATLLPHLWAVLKASRFRCDLVFGKPLAYARETIAR